MTVVDLGSMAEAARRLDLMPAAVARRIHALEGQLGASLIKRAGRSAKPTEAGMPALEIGSTFFGVLVLTGTPQAIIDQLNIAIAKLLVNPEVKETFLKQGVYATTPTKPMQSSDGMIAEVKRWERAI